MAATFTVINRADSGPGSLRQAILDANASPGPDIIAFNIAGTSPYTITPASELPIIVDPVVIDGRTQPGYAGVPLVALAGTSTTAANGLTLRTFDCEVYGLAINRFDGDGIRLQGGGRHIISANYIGTSFSGTSPLRNGVGGVTMADSANNIIGGTNADAGNLLSGNAIGVYIVGSSATGNVVQANFIGTDISGTAPLANTNGVVLYGGTGNTIGGATAAARNVISGNYQSGVYLLGPDTASNQICGNFIGTTVTGNAALGNATDGVTIYNSAANVIGGSASGEGNVIAGNNERGIFLLHTNAHDNRIQGNLVGLAANGSALGNRFTGIGFTNAPFNLVGGTDNGARNVISANQQSGISMMDRGCRSNVIIGNFIGTDVAGTNAMPNGFSGVTITQGTNNVIGGTAPGSRNIISGNAQNGVYLQGGSGTTVAGNLIGTDVTGRIAVRNRQNGVRIDANSNIVGGNTPAARNVISGNGQTSAWGVALLGSGASNNIVAANFIGVDISGASALPNSAAGIGITNAPRNWIGGIGTWDGNVISGNAVSGLYIQGVGATSNWFCGNFIGTDVSGTFAVPNAVGGIYIDGAPGNVIGTSDSDGGNVISGNGSVGIAIDGGADDTRIEGNYIGLQRNGTTLLGNVWHGIELVNAQNTVIGGTTLCAGNRIAGAATSGYDGVRVRDASSGCVIRGNSIFANGGSSPNGLAIDLSADGVNANDSLDGDGGANLLQNYPVLTSATGRFITRITGTLNSRPTSVFVLDFYGSASADSSGYGEGERWLGSATVATGISGTANFVATFTNLFGAGNSLSATATDTAGNTSEFSLALPIVSAPDTDGDGLPDDFEIASGLDPTSAGDDDQDSDGDGRSDRSELAAGTNPRDPHSVLQLTLTRLPGQALIAFPSVRGKNYDVEAADDANGPWTPIAAQVAGTGANVQRIDTTTSPRSRFYRIRVSNSGN